MEHHARKVAEVLQIANVFRLSAVETANAAYHHMMLRTAADLEERAEDIARRGGRTEND